MQERWRSREGKRVLSEAAKYIPDESSRLREQMIGEMEDSRRKYDLQKQEIDAFFDKHANWYSNSVNTHRFSFYHYHMVRILFSWLDASEDDASLFEDGNPKSGLRDAFQRKGQEKAEAQLSTLDQIRERLSLDAGRIDTVLNRGSGWYQDAIRDIDMKVLDYCRIKIYLEHVCLFAYVGALFETKRIHKMIDDDILSLEVIEGVEKGKATISNDM